MSHESYFLNTAFWWDQIFGTDGLNEAMIDRSLPERFELSDVLMDILYGASATYRLGKRRSRSRTVEVLRVDFYQSRTAPFAVVKSRFLSRDEKRSQREPGQLAEQTFHLYGGLCPDCIGVAAPTAIQIKRDQ